MSEAAIPRRMLAIPELSLVVLIGVTGSGKSTFAHQHFLPTLRTAAVGEGEIRTMTIDNPARILTIA